MSKLYFQDENSEHAYSEDFFQRLMSDENLTEIEVFEAIVVPEDKEEFVFCKDTDCCYEKSECGKHCSAYEAISSENDKCSNKGIYCEFGDKVILKAKQQ